MELFLSWSGERSRAAAEALKGWLPKLINAVDPWLSTADIDKGVRWSSEVASRLAVAKIGLICLTSGNLHSDWILFEAGALSKTMGNTYVCTLLFDSEPSDITGPLSQFQATRATKQDMRALLGTINRALGEAALTAQHLDEVFEMWWPTLEEQFKALPPENSKPAAKRSTESILEEVLALLRSGYQQREGTSLTSTDLMSAVQFAAEAAVPDVTGITPIYSAMPPPPGEPTQFRVAYKSGETFIVTTPAGVPLGQLLYTVRNNVMWHVNRLRKAGPAPSTVTQAPR